MERSGRLDVLLTQWRLANNVQLDAGKSVVDHHQAGTHESRTQWDSATLSKVSLLDEVPTVSWGTRTLVSDLLENFHLEEPQDMSHRAASSNRQAVPRKTLPSSAKQRQESSICQVQLHHVWFLFLKRDACHQAHAWNAYEAATSAIQRRLVSGGVPQWIARASDVQRKQSCNFSWCNRPAQRRMHRVQCCHDTSGSHRAMLWHVRWPGLSWRERSVDRLDSEDQPQYATHVQLEALLRDALIQRQAEWHPGRQLETEWPTHV